MRREFDERGRISAIKEGPDPDSSETRATRLVYKDTQDNRNGLLHSITDAVGRLVSYEYDDVGRVTEGTLPDGQVISFTYDANGNLTSITPPGRPAHNFLYTPINLESKDEPPALTPMPSPAVPDPATYFSYNVDGQMTQITRPDGGSIIFNYDAVNDTGQLVSKVLPADQGQLSYTYHPATALNGAGLLESMIAPDGGTLTYSYLGDLPFQEAWAGTVSGSVERIYDHHRRLAVQSVNSSSPVTFGYDSDGFMTSAGALTFTRHAQHGLPTGATLGAVADVYSRNSFGEVIQYTASVAGTPVLDIEFERDPVGRITRKTESLEGGGPVDRYYLYDQSGRLYRVCDDQPVDGECLFVRAEYQYDLNSNRTGGFDAEGGAIAANYDTQDRMLTYNAATFTYTATGELATRTEGGDTTTYEYDALGNLRHAVLHADDPNEAQVIEYLSDARNRRIGKRVDGTLVQGLLYEDQLRPVAELDGGGSVVSRFVYGEKLNVPEYMIKGGTAYRIISDHLGSPRLVINSETGVVAQRMDFDAFGNVLIDTNPGFQPFGFAGGLYDPGTGLSRFGARDYDTKTGRWTAKDPVRSFNPYFYVLNDPINLIDPTGEAASAENGIVRKSSADTIAYITKLPAEARGRINVTVYVARTKQGACYVGLTNNIARRAREHGDRFVEYTWNTELLVSRGAARRTEQWLINHLGGASKGGGILENAINSVSDLKDLSSGSPLWLVQASTDLAWMMAEAKMKFVTAAMQKGFFKCP